MDRRAYVGEMRSGSAGGQVKVATIEQANTFLKHSGLTVANIKPD
jgi:hypothetical protein